MGNNIATPKPGGEEPHRLGVNFLVQGSLNILAKKTKITESTTSFINFGGYYWGGNIPSGALAPPLLLSIPCKKVHLQN